MKEDVGPDASKSKTLGRKKNNYKEASYSKKPVCLLRFQIEGVVVEMVGWRGEGVKRHFLLALGDEMK